MPTSQDHVKFVRKRNTDGFRLKYALTHFERKSLVRELNVHCLVLFEYYLRLASVETADLTDADSADYFGWSTDTAKRHRLSLTRAGWYAREGVTLKGGGRIYIHYLGTDEVTGSGLAPKAVTETKSKPVTKPPTLEAITTPKPEVSLFAAEESANG